MLTPQCLSFQTSNFHVSNYKEGEEGTNIDVKQDPLPSVKGCGLSHSSKMAEPRTLLPAAQSWPLSDSTAFHSQGDFMVNNVTFWGVMVHHFIVNHKK